MCATHEINLSRSVPADLQVGDIGPRILLATPWRGESSRQRTARATIGTIDGRKKIVR